MRMNEFAKIIKKSGIAGNNMVKIIYQLFQALGAKEAISESVKARSCQVSNQSPSNSTIQKWLSDERNKPGVSRYFPNLKVENEEGAHNFLRKTTKEGQWIELRELFKEWHENNQNVTDGFYIDTETDDFITFSTSFWRQFVSFFDSLRMWDDDGESHSETESIRKKSKDKVANEMMDVFKEKFMEYKIYDFIPKDIKCIINSLCIYYDILKDNTKVSDCGTIQKKLYCKYFPNHEYFVFCGTTYCKSYCELTIPRDYILFKFDDGFDYNQVPTNTWMGASFKYAVVNTSIFENAKFDDEAISWKECQGEIIVIDFELSDDQDDSIIEDCYVFIDAMLALSSSIDEFMTVINEKIIKKYEDIMFDDNLRLLYNAIKQYRKLLKKFKKYLIKFRNLEKEKSRYLNDQAIKKTFDIYASLSDFEFSPKPVYPFSELYIDPEKARIIESCLCRCHKSLIELYTEIFSYRKIFSE